MIFDSAVNPFGAPVFFYKECTSTQEIARSLSPSIAPNGTVIAAGYQSAGHGRVKTRRWVSQAGENLLFTLILRFSEFDCIPECITLKTGLAVYNAAAELFPALSGRLSIKWPNDIMIGGKKTAGIAAECGGETVFLGIGINYAQQDFSDLPNATSIACELPFGASKLIIAKLIDDTKMKISLGIDENCDPAVVSLLTKVLLNIKEILGCKNNEWHKAINECLYMKNKPITFISGTAGENTRIQGILNGISKNGEILITPNGGKTPIPFVTGEQLY